MLRSLISLGLLQMLSLEAAAEVNCGCPEYVGCTLDMPDLDLLACDVINGDVDLKPKPGTTKVALKARAINGRLKLSSPTSGAQMLLDAPDLKYVNGSINAFGEWVITAPNMNCFGGWERDQGRDLATYGNGYLTLKLGDNVKEGVNVVGSIGKAKLTFQALDISQANIRSISNGGISPGKGQTNGGGLITTAGDGVLSLPRLQAIEGYCPPPNKWNSAPLCEYGFEMAMSTHPNPKEIDFPVLKQVGGRGIDLVDFQTFPENNAPIVSMKSLESLKGGLSTNPSTQSGGLTHVYIGTIDGASLTKGEYKCADDTEINGLCNEKAPNFEFVSSCIAQNPYGPDGPHSVDGVPALGIIIIIIIVVGTVGCVVCLACLIYVLVIKKRSNPRQFFDVDSGANGQEDYTPPKEEGV